jgi:MSHA biogenesis protein MshL
VPLILTGVVLPLSAQAPAPRPPDLFVTRIQGPSPATQGAAPVALPHVAELPPLPVTELDERLRTADLDDGRRVSLTVSRPMPLRELLMLLVNGTPFSLVTDESVDGTFLGELKDLTMRQALEAVLFPRGLDYDVQGTLVRVFPRKASTRLFDVNYLDVRRTWRRDIGDGASGEAASSAVRTSIVSNVDRFDELSSGVQVLLSASGRLHVDRGAGLLQVTDFADRLDLVAVYVEAVQMRAMRQVRIDAQVLQVTFAEGTSSIDWIRVAQRAGAGTRSSSGRAAAGLIVADTNLLKSAIAEQGVVTTVATPQFVAMNNEPAVMRVGSAGAYVDGLTLSVTAQISADGLVLLNATPTYTAQAQASELKRTNGARPAMLHGGEADTTARVQDGETMVLSGFVDTRVSEKPAAGFAAMFGMQPRTATKSEVVILLTPRIVDPGQSGPR